MNVIAIYQRNNWKVYGTFCKHNLVKNEEIIFELIITFIGHSNRNDLPETPDKMHFKYNFRNATKKDPGRRVWRQGPSGHSGESPLLGDRHGGDQQLDINLTGVSHRKIVWCMFCHLVDF